jgi:hypothetical protein
LRNAKENDPGDVYEVAAVEAVLIGDQLELKSLPEVEEAVMGDAFPFIPRLLEDVSTFVSMHGTMGLTLEFER